MSLRLNGRPMAVECTDNGQPHMVPWRGRRQRVSAVFNRWRVDSRWWDEPVTRDYHKVLLEDGTLMLLAHDRADDAWHIRRIYG